MENANPAPASGVDGRHLAAGVVLTLLGGVGWGFSGTCAQYLFAAYGVDPFWLVAARLNIAAVFFVAVMLVARRGMLLRLLRTPRDMLEVAAFALFGVLACGMCYLRAIEASDAGTATVLQSLNLLIILGASCARLGRKPRRKEWVGVGLATGGTFLLATHGSLTSLAISPDGLIWGLATAVSCALYTLLPARPLAKYDSIVVTGSAMVVAAAASDVLFRPWVAPPQLDVAGIGMLAAMAVVGTIVAFLCYLTGVKLVGSMLAGLLGCSEPVTACLLSTVWMGTVFAPVDLVGIAMILAMMVLMV